MKPAVILAGLAGVLGAAWLVFHIGAQSIWDAMAKVGWSGLALLCLYGAANFILLGSAWLTLDPPYAWRKAVTFVWGRAVRDSAGELLPFSQIGGLVIGARAVILRGISQPVAFASTIVDMAMEMAAQAAFVAAGLVLLAIDLPNAVWQSPLVRSTALGFVFAIPFVCGFLVLQRRGFALIERAAKRLLPAWAAGAAAVSTALNDIHEAPGRMVAGFCLHIAGWLAGAFGTWLALFLLRVPMAFVDALSIEAVLAALRSVTVFVPAAIGVQEAGYALLMPLFGLPPQLGIAVSLLKRGREIALGVPILLAWQVAEGRSALSATREVKASISAQRER
jgi:glycosyltransferase 2 family protein